MSYAKIRQTLAEVLVTALNIPEDDIATLIPENEEEFKGEDFKTTYLDLDRKRIADIKQVGKDKFEQGYSKAKKEERSNFENEIKAEFSITDENLIGLDLVKAVAEASSKNGKIDVSKLTEEQLTTHPGVIKLLNEKDKTYQESEKKLKEEYDTKISTLNRAQLFGRVSKKALTLLDSLNPVLSEDPTRATNQKNWLLRELEGFDYQEGDDGEFIPLQDGKRVENAHGHGIGFDKHVKGIAEKLYDFKKADPRQTPSGGGGGDDTPPNFPKTEAEYAKMMSDRSIPLEDRIKIKAEWNKQG